MSLDALTPDQARRFQLWRAVTELSQAQADGHLSTEQVELLDGLAESLRTLADRLSELAGLSQELLERSRRTPGDRPA